MKKTAQKIIFGALCGITIPAFAIVNQPAPSYVPQAADHTKNVFITLGSGYSWSTHADISVDTSFWDPSPQGYNSSLGNSSIFNAEAGYIFNPLLSFGLGVSYRGDYSYSQFQTSSAAATPGFNGDKTRYFDVNSTALMANLYLNKFGDTHYLNYQFTPTMSIHPFIGAGIGVAYNQMTNFHSVLGNGTDVVSLMADNTEKSFAYQAMVGLALELNKTVSIDGGYRYFNGGDIQSSNYLEPGTAAPVVAPAWTGKLQSNEVFVEINFAI